jgi:hypothetical protein
MYMTTLEWNPLPLPLSFSGVLPEQKSRNFPRI